MNRRKVPILFYLLTGLIALAATLTFPVWMRHFTLVFGYHTQSVTTMVASLFLCLALGSYIAGKRVDKARNTLIISIVLPVFSGIFTMFHHRLIVLLSDWFIALVQHNPGPLELTLVRILLSFLFFLVPAGLFAGQILFFTRSFIKHVGHSGRYYSAMVLAVSLGGISGLIMLATFLIPALGFKAAGYAGAIPYFVVAALAAWHYYRIRTNSVRIAVPFHAEASSKRSIRFKKRKNVLEAGAKLTRAMLKVYAFEGFTLVSMLLLSFRILNHYNLMKPLYFQLAVFILILTGMALGSLLYNRFAEKPANKYITLATFQIVSGFISLFSYAALYFLGDPLFRYIQQFDSYGSRLLMQGLLFSLLLLVPSLIIGITLPLAGRLYPKRLQHIGYNYSRLGIILYLSLLSGLILTDYLLMPLMGSLLVYFVLALLTMLSGIYIVFRDSRLIRGFRLGYAVIAIALFVVVSGTLKILGFTLHGQQIDQKIEGSTATVSVITNPDHTQSIYRNGKYSFGNDKNSLRTQILPACIPLLINQSIESALVIGFGSGITASILEYNQVSEIHIAEFSPEMVRLSSDVFAEQNNDIMTSSDVTLTLEDARGYLIRTKGEIDLISTSLTISDCMPGNFTLEFYRICFDRLAGDGLLCQLLPARGIGELAFRSLLKACAEVFPNVSLWYASPENVLMVASKNEHEREFCQLSEAFNNLKINTEISLEDVGLQDLQSLLANAFMNNNQIRSFAGHVKASSDNRPYAAFESGLESNDRLPALFRVPVDYNGIFSFGKACEADTVELKGQIQQINQSLRQQALFSSAEKP